MWPGVTLQVIRVAASGHSESQLLLHSPGMLPCYNCSRRPEFGANKMVGRFPDIIMSQATDFRARRNEVHGKGTFTMSK